MSEIWGLEMCQAKEVIKGRGAHGDHIVEGYDLAVETCGAHLHADAGLTAFAYLWRRFGPPQRGADYYKVVCCYWLTTPHPDVWLTISPRGCGLEYAVGYYASAELNRAAGEGKPPFSNWRDAEGATREINQALFDALRELRRPVYVRDVPIDLLGVCDGGVPEDVVKRSGSDHEAPVFHLNNDR